MNNPSVFYLFTSCGHLNYGDEVIVRGWIATLRALDPAATILVDCLDPAAAKVVHGSGGGRVEYVNFLWRCVWGSPYGLDAAERWLALMDERSDRFLPFQFIDQLCGSLKVSLILVGGGYLADEWPLNRNILATAVFWKRKRGWRLFASGIGLFPQPAAEVPAIRRLTSEFEVFGVRDRETLQVAGGTLTGDDMLHFTTAVSKPRMVQQRAREAKCLHVCLQNDNHGDVVTRTVLVEWALSVARHWQRRMEGLKVRFLEFHPGDLGALGDQRLEGLEFVSCFNLLGVGCQKKEVHTKGGAVVDEPNEGGRIRFGDKLRHQLEDSGTTPGVKRRLLVSEHSPRVVGVRNRVIDHLGIKPGDYCMTTRFHLHLLGFLAGATGIALFGNEYYRAKHRSIAAVSRWKCLGANALPVPENVPIPKPKLIRGLASTLARKAEEVEQISRLISRTD